MKKLLEVITDDDMKTIELSADGELIEKCFGIENLKATDASFRVVTKALVEKIWKEKDTAVSRIIRILSMSEACSCAYSCTALAASCISEPDRICGKGRSMAPPNGGRPRN